MTNNTYDDPTAVAANDRLPTTAACRADGLASAASGLLNAIGEMADDDPLHPAVQHLHNAVADYRRAEAAERRSMEAS